MRSLSGYFSVLFKVDRCDRYGTALNAGVLTGVLGGYTTFNSTQLYAVKLIANFFAELGKLLLMFSAGLGAPVAARY